MRAELALNEASVNGDDVLVYPALDYWVLIGGLLEGQVRMDSITIEEGGDDGITRARCTVVNPDTTIVEGKTFSVVWRSEIIFAGIIRTVTIDADPSETAFFYAIEADGWDSLLARHTITATYANKTAGFILRDAIQTSGLDLDGVTAGMIDEGPELILVEADHVRMSDFIRDIGSAGGGLASIDANKQIQFRPTTVNTFAEGTIWNGRAEKISHIGDIDNYRNRQVVKVTGLDGTTTVTETRNDLTQQALRIADEGGSGIYEAYEEVKHPTSSVVGDLSILGQTVGFVDLRTYSRNARRVTVTLRDPAPRIGQLALLNLPGFGLSGTFVAMRKTWRDLAGQFLFDVEFWESAFQQRALESLLKIVGAAKSSMSITADVFPNVQLFSTVGSFTWTVPAGITAAQFTVIGGSGGGSGGASHTGLLAVGAANGINPPLQCGGLHPFHSESQFGTSGGSGGRSGRAVTIFASLVPGTDVTIVVGAGGSAGASDSNVYNPDLPVHTTDSTTATLGTDGQDSTVTYAGALICRGDKGLKAPSAGISTISAPFGSSFRGIVICETPGVDGPVTASGVGDVIIPSAGNAGGNEGTGVPLANPGAGLSGFVEVRW